MCPPALLNGRGCEEFTCIHPFLHLITSNLPPRSHRSRNTRTLPLTTSEVPGPLNILDSRYVEMLTCWRMSGSSAILHMMSVLVSERRQSINLNRCGDAKARRMVSFESEGSSCDRQLSTRGAHCFESARASHWTRPGCLGTWEEAMGAEGHRASGAALLAVSKAASEYLRMTRMSYWWAMGKIRKATSLLSSERLGPRSSSIARGKAGKAPLCVADKVGFQTTRPRMLHLDGTAASEHQASPRMRRQPEGCMHGQDGCMHRCMVGMVTQILYRYTGYTIGMP